MKIKIEPFLIKRGNRVGKGAIEFDEPLLKSWHLVGFTICNDTAKGLYVLFPASIIKKESGNKPFFFLRPPNSQALADLEDKILDEYEKMVDSKGFNSPRFKGPKTELETIVAIEE